MPTVTLNKNVFEKLVGKELPTDKLKERISYLGTDLEKIEGNEIHVEIFPNRPDMLSEQGFARAFSSFIGIKTGLRKYEIKKSNDKVIIDKSVGKVRPYTACAIVKELKFDDEKIREIIQIQEKLHVTYCRNRTKAAIGIYPFEKIKTPIRYLAMDPRDIKFRPLEAAKEMNGMEILQKHPTGKEYASLLEGEPQFPIFIDANNNILSMPPIINSHETGKITEKTKDVFIECSGFDYRIQSKCLNMVVTALADMGGKLYSMELLYPKEFGGKKISPDLTPERMKIDINYVNKILGLKLNEHDVKKLIERMGFGYKNKTIFIPSYRTDILHQYDLIEDIAIAYGYENFKPEMPNLATIGEENKFETFKKRIAEILIGIGLNEVSTYHLGNKDDFTAKMNNNNKENNGKLVTLANSISAEYNVLRSWMLPCLMNVLKANKHNEYPQKIFDIGTVFRKNTEKETNVEEFQRLAVLICDENSDYTRIKQIIDYLMRMLDIEYKVVETEHSSFIQGRVARVIVKDRKGKTEKKVAYIGEIHPKVLENFEIEMPVAGFELNLSELFEMV